MGDRLVGEEPEAAPALGRGQGLEGHGPPGADQEGRPASTSPPSVPQVRDAAARNTNRSWSWRLTSTRPPSRTRSRRAASPARGNRLARPRTARAWPCRRTASAAPQGACELRVRRPRREPGCRRRERAEEGPGALFPGDGWTKVALRSGPASSSSRSVSISSRFSRRRRSPDPRGRSRRGSQAGPSADRWASSRAELAEQLPAQLNRHLVHQGAPAAFGGAWSGVSE